MTTKQNVHNIIWLSKLIKGRKHLIIDTLQLHALLGELNPSFKRPCPFAIAMCLHPPIIGSCQISPIEFRPTHVFLIFLHTFFGPIWFYIKQHNTIYMFFYSTKKTCHVLHISVLLVFFLFRYDLTNSKFESPMHGTWC